MLCVAACGGERPSPHNEEDDLWTYGYLGLAEPGTWEELVEAEPSLDTIKVMMTPDIMGPMWRQIRVVAPGGSHQRLDLTPDSIKVDLIMSGREKRGGPRDPFVYLLDYQGDGFHWVGYWIVVPVGTVLLVEEQDWGSFQLEEGRLVLHEEGIEFIPGPVDTPEGLCETYVGKLAQRGARECGPEAVKPRTPER